jgi:hypothetical protein
MSSEDSLPELSASTRNSEIPEISGEEIPVDQADDGLSENLAPSEEEAGGSDQDTGDDAEHAGIDLNSYTRGAWMGSDVTQAEIDWLYRSRRIPEQVFSQIPGKEREPAPRPGETVVFATHFERGLGLQVLGFIRHFLNFYELQPHHLLGNTIFYLSSFVSFMEGFIGLSPTVKTFA